MTEHDSAPGQPLMPPGGPHSGVELCHLRYLATCDMVRVCLDRHPLTARAAVAWSGDLPRPLQQLLFDTADAGVALAGPVDDG